MSIGEKSVSSFYMDPEVRLASDWSTETEKSRLGSDFNFTFLTETEWLRFSMAFNHFQWGLIWFCFCFILYHFVLFWFVSLIMFCLVLFCFSLILSWFCWEVER